MYFDFEKLDVYQVALDEEPACPVTVTISGSGSGLSGPFCSKVSAQGPWPAPA